MWYIASMFKKRHRLTAREFDQYFKSGRRVHSPAFTLIYHYAEGEYKVAMVVPKKVVKTAVKRNLLRRRLLHILRPIIAEHQGIFIFIAKKNAANGSVAELQAELTEIVGRVI